MASNYGRRAGVVYDASEASYWNNQQYVNAPTLVPGSAEQVALSQVTVQFGRTEATGIREDVAEFSLYAFVDSGVGVPTAKLNATQAAAVEGFLDSWWTTCRVTCTNHWNLSAYKWRDITAAGPISTKTGFVLPSPTWRTTLENVAGTATVPGLPDQSAASVTFVTASRRHWGRIYMPATAGAYAGSFGRFTTAYADLVAGAFDTLFNAMGTSAAPIVPVVWSAKYRGMLTLASLKVDDVPDVIRRRRPKTKTYEKLYANTA